MPRSRRKPAAGRTTAPDAERVGEVAERALPTPEERMKTALERLAKAGLKKEAIARVSADVLEDLATALTENLDQDREEGEVKEKLISAAPGVSKAQDAFEKADAARKTAKAALDEALDEEHALVMTLVAIRHGNYQKTLPLATPKKASQSAQDAPGGAKPTDAEALDAGRDYVTRLVASGKAKGVGPTSLARVVYGQATKEFKAAATRLLEELEKEGVLVKTESGKGEPTWWPAKA